MIDTAGMCNRPWPKPISANSALVAWPVCELTAGHDGPHAHWMYGIESRWSEATPESPVPHYVEEIRKLRQELKRVKAQWESAALYALAHLRDEEPAAKRLRLELTEQEKAA